MLLRHCHGSACLLPHPRLRCSRILACGVLDVAGGMAAEGGNVVGDDVCTFVNAPATTIDTPTLSNPEGDRFNRELSTLDHMGVKSFISYKHTR